MIEIFKREDIKGIKDNSLKKYLEYSFNRLPQEFKYPEYGYFVVIEDIDELLVEVITLSNHSINGLNYGLYEDINMVEMGDEIIEVLILINNDINISLLIPVKILDELHQERLLCYQI